MAGRSSRGAFERQAAVERVLSGQRASTVAREIGVHPATVHRLVNDASAGPGSMPTDLRLLNATQDLLRDQDDSKRELFRAAIDDAAVILNDAMRLQCEGAHWPEEPLLQLSTCVRLSLKHIYATPSAHVLLSDHGVPRSDSFPLRWQDTLPTPMSRQQPTRSPGPCAESTPLSSMAEGGVR